MATILELEVHIDPTRDTINGQAYFAGAHRAIGDIFNDEDRVRASVEVTGGLTGTETALRFYYHPASAGLERLDKVIWHNQPTPQVSARWQEKRPQIVSRLALTQDAQR